MIEYMDTRQYCTKYNSIISTFLQINASFVQGSRIGPIAYVYNASDLHTLLPGNDLNKYADDTYLIVPSSNSHTVSLELEHISEWAQCNNLMLNTAKSMEMIIHEPGVKLGNLSVPQPLAGVTRCSSLKILGVTVTNTLSFDLHISNVVARCAQKGYAVRILRSHGLIGPAVWKVTCATLISKLVYASPAWFGFLNESCKERCQGIIQKLKCSGYLGNELWEFYHVVWGCWCSNVQHLPSSANHVASPTGAFCQKLQL